MAKKEIYGKIKGQNLVVLIQTKKLFLTLCKQYDHMGNLLKLQSKTLKHSTFSSTCAPEVLGRIIQQHYESGEQLKELGAGLDLLGGNPVLEEPEKKTFVSNIEPPEDEEEDTDAK